MYHCVQSLLSVHLKPELMLDGKVERLLPFENDAAHSGRENSRGVIDAELPEGSSSRSSPSSLSSLSSISTLSQVSDADVDVALSDHEEATVAGHVADAVFKDAKTPWTDDDIRRMIELKAQGHTHEQVAVRTTILTSHQVPPSPLFLLFPFPFSLPALLSYYLPASK